jgi:hypothetical protein
MSLQKFIEEKIQKAIADGEFKNLKGAGKPINLDAYFNTPEDFRVGYTLLKNNDFVPFEVELLKEIGELKEKIKNCSDEVEKRKLTKLFNEKSLALSITLEKNKRKKRS